MPKTRLLYLDNIRSLVIFLVITMHSAVTYSGFGSWYYIEGSPENLPLFEMVVFGFLQSFLQAWFMGILFFISAFFTARSLAKYGSKTLIKERLFRLGLPVLLFMLIVDPFISRLVLHQYSGNSIFHDYSNYLLSLDWLSSSGPLWFAEALLIFCIIYIIARKLIPKQKVIIEIKTKHIITAIIVTGITAFLIRLIFPIGTAFFNLQFSYFASYIMLFISGIIAGENNLLDLIAAKKNIKWIKLSLIIGIPFWCIIMLLGGVLDGNFFINGGFYWQSFAYAFWESFIAIGFSIGLLAFSREKVNISNNFSALLAENAFAIYFFHAPILTAISVLFKNWVTDPMFKFVAITLCAFIFSFGFSFIVRKIKPLGILFK